LLRYRGAALAEFWRALRALKALQAEQAAASGRTIATHSTTCAARPALADRAQPNEPKRAAEPELEYVMPEPPAPRRTLHEPAPLWLPNEPVPMPAQERERLHRGPAWGNSGDAGEGAPGRCSGLSSILGE
jgi:hypothetical protein